MSVLQCKTLSVLSDSVTITLSKQNHKTHFIETEQYLSTNVYSKDRKVNTIDEMTDWYVAGLHTSSIWARDIPYDVYMNVLQTIF